MASRLIVADCRDAIAGLPDASVDAVVSDPPYELGFMGKGWDASGIAYNTDLWRDVLRVLKPGGHLLAFGGTRTCHRLACAIEDAGFEIRDSIHWVYGSGFPKSLDVSKAIDKAAGAPVKVGKAFVVAGEYGGRELRDPETGADREAMRHAAVTDDAKAWQGWGTALKPAHEPIVVARKPLAGTVAQTVLAYGTGAINIDGCRVGTGGGTTKGNPPKGQSNGIYGNGINGACDIVSLDAGRWPPNFLLTHAEGCEEACVEGCPVREMDAQSGVGKSSPFPTRNRQGTNSTTFAAPGSSSTINAAYTGGGYSDTGGASRFFPAFRYQAKASRRERNAGLDGMPEKREADRVKADGPGGDNPRNRSNTAKQNFHPTVKPVELMRWLCRLVTPPGGVVLDPFTGSGTTGVAAVLEGFDFIGIEREPEYAEIAQRRIAHAQNSEPTLFQSVH